jgi:malate dehydrogenase (oxaloacetate-decarboxylating)
MGGLLEVSGKISLDSIEALSIAYTLGIAEPCRKIAENERDAYKYTMKKN